MKRLLLLAFVLFAMVFGAVAVPPTGPRLKLEKKSYDLGDVPRGTIAVDTVRFRNVGEDTLVITNVQSSCGCTVAKYSHAPLAPKASGTIVVKFDAGNRSLGKFRKTLYIRSNALNHRELVFVDGNIVAAQ